MYLSAKKSLPEEEIIENVYQSTSEDILPSTEAEELWNISKKSVSVTVFYN